MHPAMHRDIYICLASALAGNLRPRRSIVYSILHTDRLDRLHYAPIVYFLPWHECGHWHMLKIFTERTTQGCGITRELSFVSQS
jgi:hypothetical protein